MIFHKNLKWDSISILRAMTEKLEKLQWDVDTSLGFEDNGMSAFVITAKKEKNVIVIFLENEIKSIRIKAGIDGKYLAPGKKMPKYNKAFSNTQLNQASKFFEKIIDEIEELNTTSK